MNRPLHFSILFLAFLLPGLSSFAQVKFTTNISSKEIGRDEYLQIEFVVENAKQIEQLTPPDFSGFQVAQGPIQSSGMSVINGNMTQYKSLSFVLQPTKTGNFTIAGASAVVDGKQMQSNAVKITVTAHSTGNGNNGGNAGANSNPFPASPFSSMPSMGWPDPSAEGQDANLDYELKPGENINDKIHKDLFLKLQVDKTTCFVGEPIVATYKLYSRLNAESRITKSPSLNGFSVNDMINPNTDAASIEKVNGKSYQVHTLRKAQLVPLQAGTIDLDPVEVENTVHFIKRTHAEPRRSTGNSLRDLFDQMADEDMGEEVARNITLDTKPVTITIKPLPEDKKPAGFGGAVGSFSIEASLANNSVSAEDEGSLHVVVKGKGNLSVINAPPITWPAGIDAYNVKAKEDINKTTVPMSGSKSFDYVFIPSKPGHFTLPAVDFSYFDPASGSYKTISTNPVELQVTPATKKHSSPAPQANSAQADNGGGIKDFVQHHLEWVVALLLLSGLAVWLARQNIRLRKKEKEQKEAAARKAAAEKEAAALLLQKKAVQDPAMPGAFTSFSAPVTDPLEDARTFFERNDYKSFYREVNRAIWKTIEKTLHFPASELNKNNVVRRLETKGWDKTMVLGLENFLNECEMNLYTPAFDTYNMQQLLRQGEQLISDLTKSAV